VNPLTEARQWLVETCRPVVAPGTRIYHGMPEVPTAPCLIVEPAAPWIDSSGNTLARTKVNLQVTLLFKPTAGNDEAMLKIEEHVWQLLGVLAGHGAVEPTRLDSIGSAELYRIDIPISVMVDDK
jgi:hypothetical protein